MTPRLGSIASLLLVSLALLLGPARASSQAFTSVVGWGGAGLGGPPNTAGYSNLVAISAQASWLGLAADGTIPGVPGLSNVTAIAAGESHDLAVTNGSVYAWGDNSAGELNVPAGLTNAVAVAAGVQDSLALTRDGAVIGWGYNRYGQVSIPPGLSNVVRLAAGYYHSLALKSDGTVVAWGYGADGETNVPAGLANVVSIAGGYYHSLALRTDGTVVAWGGNGSGQTQVPAGLSNVVAIAAGANHSMALKSDGTVVAWGDDFYGQTNVPAGLANVVDLAGAYTYSLALTNDGSPWVVRQPQDHLAYAGASASFSVVALGQAPLAYQWQSNGVAIAGATTATLTLTNVQAAASGLYRVAITNSAGWTLSSNALLTVVPPPVISIQPQSLATNGGATVSFAAIVTGPGPPPSCQWRFDGTNLPGATAATLTLTNVLDSQSGAYSLLASNSAGTILSPDAMLTVQPWVQPSIQPNSVVVGSGTYALFALTAGGFSSNTVYQWRQNGTSLGSFWAWTNPSAATFLSPTMTNAGAYDVVATDPYTSVTSPPVTLTVIPLEITVPPTNRAVWRGGSAAFTVSAIGATPIGYQWQFNGTNLPGANTNSLLLTNVQDAQLGAYSVLVTNAWTNLTSSLATLSRSEVAVWGGLNGESNLTPGLTNVIAISSGLTGSSDCQALFGDGTVALWPANSAGFALRSATNLVAIAGASPGFGVRPSGALVGFPSDGTGVLSTTTNAVAISAYAANYLALNGSGTVTGYTGGLPWPPGLTNVVAVAQGGGHDLALKADGTVTAWGNNSAGQATVPPGLNQVSAIAAGSSHSVALREDGTVVAWGSNANGQTNVPAGLSNVVAIAAGGFHSLALKANGSVAAWGLGAQGQTNVPPTLTNVIAIAAGQYLSMALLGEGQPLTPFLLSGAFSGSNYTVSLPSQSGHIFVPEYKNSLSETSWHALPPVAGNGVQLLLTDPAATNAARFYRVRRW